MSDDNARRLADLSAAIRDYLTTETDVSSPSFHATALTHRLAQAQAEVLCDVAAKVADQYQIRPMNGDGHNYALEKVLAILDAEAGDDAPSRRFRHERNERIAHEVKRVQQLNADDECTCDTALAGDLPCLVHGVSSRRGSAE